jgi:hypothetical protein
MDQVEGGSEPGLVSANRRKALEAFQKSIGRPSSPLKYCAGRQYRL